ncbi:hypothetical protein [Deinococcus roseus]|uniref:Uncharacterized protein n=1 Tax=Deinococcus roseus TaxID=392414 RepID=A0ABQ2CZ69_9DEIO|nr:hypothetical protein [Deinococcus roseus]GGJ35471.1 hypothetical protein GCM10008938_21940 [Deinococcus roseus]
MTRLLLMIRALCMGVKYQPLEVLMDQQMVFTSLDHLQSDADVAFQHLGLPACTLYRREDRIYQGQIHKYGLLDLVFEVIEPIEIPSPENPLQFLKSMGILMVSKENPEEKPEGDEFGVLQAMYDDLQEEHQYLKVMLHEVNPVPPVGMERAKQWIFGNKSPEGTFPRTFEVTDACLTNLNGIWFSRHFYL